MGIMGHCIVQAALSTHSVFTMIASYSRTGLRNADGSRGRLREGSQDLLRAGEGLRFLSSGEGLRRRSLHAHHKVASAPPNSCFKGKLQPCRVRERRQHPAFTSIPKPGVWQSRALWAPLGLRVRLLTGVRERAWRGLGLRLLRPLPASEELLAIKPAYWLPITC